MITSVRDNDTKRTMIKNKTMNRNNKKISKQTLEMPSFTRNQLNGLKYVSTSAILDIII